MSVAKQHYCPGQISIAIGDSEPPAPKCRCRKYISIEAARKMVENEEASWVIVERVQKDIEMPCSLCHGDPEVKNCANCRSKGKETKMVLIPRYGNDIVLVSRRPADKKEKKRSSSLAKKTPRVATIEEEHIELAYVEGVKEAAERIEEYGRLILDARMFVGPKRIPAIGVEPENNQKRGEGRRYDYGRTI